jgi:hypothetical protein
VLWFLHRLIPVTLAQKEILDAQARTFRRCLAGCPPNTTPAEKKFFLDLLSIFRTKRQGLIGSFLRFGSNPPVLVVSFT